MSRRDRTTVTTLCVTERRSVPAELLTVLQPAWGTRDVPEARHGRWPVERTGEMLVQRQQNAVFTLRSPLYNLIQTLKA